jgi:hypothetical protein
MHNELQTVPSQVGNFVSFLRITNDFFMDFYADIIAFAKSGHCFAFRITVTRNKSIVPLDMQGIMTNQKRELK